MTDEEIIKVLEICTSDTTDCKDCPLCLYNEKCGMLEHYAFGLIKRQQAEIEKLKTQQTYKIDIDVVRNGAIREFAEKVRIESEWYFGYNISRNKLIYRLVKEMTEDTND